MLNSIREKLIQGIKKEEVIFMSSRFIQLLSLN